MAHKPTGPVGTFNSTVLESPDVTGLTRAPPVIKSIDARVCNGPHSYVFTDTTRIFTVYVDSVDTSYVHTPPRTRGRVDKRLSSDTYSATHAGHTPAASPVRPPVGTGSGTTTAANVPCEIPFVAADTSFSPISFYTSTEQSLCFLRSQGFDASFNSDSLPDSAELPSSGELYEQLHTIVHV